MVEGKAVAFADRMVNNWPSMTAVDQSPFYGHGGERKPFYLVQSLLVDRADRPWVLDTGGAEHKNAVPSRLKSTAGDRQTPVQVQGM